MFLPQIVGLLSPVAMHFIVIFGGEFFSANCMSCSHDSLPYPEFLAVQHEAAVMCRFLTVGLLKRRITVADFADVLLSRLPCTPYAGCALALPRYLPIYVKIFQRMAHRCETSCVGEGGFAAWCGTWRAASRAATCWAASPISSRPNRRRGSGRPPLPADTGEAAERQARPCEAEAPRQGPACCLLTTTRRRVAPRPAGCGRRAPAVMCKATRTQARRGRGAPGTRGRRAATRFGKANGGRHNRAEVGQGISQSQVSQRLADSCRGGVLEIRV